MLTDKMSTSIWVNYSLTGDLEVRNFIVSKYLYLTKIIVGKLYPTYNNHVEYEDLLSYGILGLIDAIEKFDYKKGIKFETYASIRIRGCIIDNIREYDWISSYLRQKLTKVEHAFNYLERRNGRPATEAEVAKYMDIDEKELGSLMVDYRATNIVYLDELLPANGHCNLFSREDAPEDCYEKKELKEILIKHLNLLPCKEKTVIDLYYFKKLRLKQIGNIMGVSESRVSQIHSSAISRLKSAISNVI